MEDSKFDKKGEVGDPVFLVVKPMTALGRTGGVTEVGKVVLRSKHFFRDEKMFDSLRKDKRFVLFGKISKIDRFRSIFEYEAASEFKAMVHDQAIEEAERRLLRDPGILKKVAENIVDKMDREKKIQETVNAND